MLVMLLVPAGGAGAPGGAPTLTAHLSPRSRRIAGGLLKKQAQFHPHLDNGQVWILRTNRETVYNSHQDERINERSPPKEYLLSIHARC